MMYHTCPYCGDNLDPGEKCECTKTAVPARIRIENSHRQYHYITRKYDLSKVTFLTKLNGEVIVV